MKKNIDWLLLLCAMLYYWFLINISRETEAAQLSIFRNLNNLRFDLGLSIAPILLIFFIILINLFEGEIIEPSGSKLDFLNIHHFFFWCMSLDELFIRFVFIANWCISKTWHILLQLNKLSMLILSRRTWIVLHSIEVSVANISTLVNDKRKLYFRCC